MNHTLRGRSVGLAVGGTAAILHALWAVIVGVMPDVAQKFLNFAMALHFINMPFTVQAFSWGGAIALVAFAFCIGYLLGRLFAAVYNSVAR